MFSSCLSVCLFVRPSPARISGTTGPISNLFEGMGDQWHGSVNAVLNVTGSHPLGGQMSKTIALFPHNDENDAKKSCSSRWGEQLFPVTFPPWPPIDPQGRVKVKIDSSHTTAKATLTKIVHFNEGNNFFLWHFDLWLLSDSKGGE
jgi:hypothetical protein